MTQKNLFIRSQVHGGKRKKTSLLLFPTQSFVRAKEKKTSFPLFFSDVSSTPNYSVTVIVDSMWFEQTTKTARFSSIIQLGAFFVCFSRKRRVRFLFSRTIDRI